MATQGPDGRPAHGLGAAVKEVAERASAIVRLELELAAMELRRKVVSLGLGIALALAAAIVLLFVVGFAFATIAAALATTVATWLAPGSSRSRPARSAPRAPRSAAAAPAWATSCGCSATSGSLGRGCSRFRTAELGKSRWPERCEPLRDPRRVCAKDCHWSAARTRRSTFRTGSRETRGTSPRRAASRS